MDCYKLEKDKLYKACHTKASNIAFICMTRAFAHSIAEDILGAEAKFNLDEFMGIPVIQNESVDGCFELILKEQK